MNFLKEPFIKSLIVRLIQPDVVGPVLVGSYARGQNTPQSDVDVDFFVENPPSETYSKTALRISIVMSLRIHYN